MEAMTDGDWRGLAGTTAEWLFLGRGRRLYSAKGVRGGERARPSSFSMSAAAFGGTSFMTQLIGAQPRPSQRKGEEADAEIPLAICEWKEAASF